MTKVKRLKTTLTNYLLLEQREQVFKINQGEEQNLPMTNILKETLEYVRMIEETPTSLGTVTPRTETMRTKRTTSIPTSLTSTNFKKLSIESSNRINK